MSDHVFKRDADGRLQFIGDFDGLYRDNPDPWDQGAETGEKADYYRRSRSRLAFLHSFAQPHGGEFLDVGCGHGHSTMALNMVGAGRWSGCDISGEAVRRAKLNYPLLNFWQSDIRSGGVLGGLGDCFDGVVLSELFWYVLPDLELVLTRAQQLTVPGGMVWLTQGCLWEERQEFAREEALGVTGVMQRFCQAANEVGGFSFVVGAVDHLAPRLELDHIVIGLQVQK